MVTGITEETETELADQFTADTGIDVDIVRLPGSDLYERVVSEYGAGKLSFDVIRSTDVTAAEDMASKGVFAETKTPFDAQLSKDGARDIGEGPFLSSFYSACVVVYNNQTVPEGSEPTSWDAFADPEFKDGQIGLVNPNGAGYTVAATDLMLREIGEEGMVELKSLNPRIYDTSSVLGPALGQGELSLATMSLSTARNLVDAGAPLSVVLNDDTPVSAGYTPFGITKVGADNPAAQVFVNWQMSKAGQRVAGEAGLVPSRSDLEARTEIDGKAIVLPKPGAENLVVFTTKDRLEREDEVLTTWNDIFKYTG